MKNTLTFGGVYDTIHEKLPWCGDGNLSRIQKLKKKFYEKPIRNDMTFDEIRVLAEAYGCVVRPGGKHMRVVCPENGAIVPIPRHGKTVEEAYIKQLRDLFDSIGDIVEA